MKNKGFTLIELIITIALLAVILIISFVSINKVIEQNNINNCITLTANISKAANEYASDRRYDREFISNIVKDGNGNNVYSGLSVQELIDANYMSGPLVNPFDKNEIDPESVKVNIFFTAKGYLVDYVDVSYPDELEKLKECDGSRS